MDIRNVGKNGGVEQGSNRAKRTDAKPAILVPYPSRDEARISTESQKTASAVENLAERARTSGASEREAVVAKATAKLLGGELDDEKTLTATAQRLLDAKFLSA